MSTRYRKCENCKHYLKDKSLDYYNGLCTNTVGDKPVKKNFVCPMFTHEVGAVPKERMHSQRNRFGPPDSNIAHLIYKHTGDSDHV